MRVRSGRPSDDIIARAEAGGLADIGSSVSNAYSMSRIEIEISDDLDGVCR